MNVHHDLGFDVHKKSISYCVELADGTIVEEGKLPAQLATLRHGPASLRWLGTGAIEATLFSGWIYDAWNRLPRNYRWGIPP